jgi:hypothetical protein
MGLGVVALIAALALAIVPARASAATPVLEFASPGVSFPIEFEAFSDDVSARLGDFDKVVNCEEAEGGGDITGPRTTSSIYFFYGCVAEDIGGGNPVECVSPDAVEEEEIRSERIEAEPVYLDQSKHEVAMLLNPGGGTYMEFACGATDIVAQGSFLAPVTPVNTLISFFTAKLTRNGNAQIPTQYEDLSGVKHQAIPTAIVNGTAPDYSGVGLTFAIATGVPLEIKSVNAAEVEAKQRAEEEAAAKKRQEEEAAAKKRQEDEAAAKKRAEEETAAKEALARRLAERKAIAKKVAHERQLRAKGLKRCRGLGSKPRRIRCETRVKKKYIAHKAGKGPKGGKKN